MKKNQALGKHSHNNRESREALVLKYIREIKKISQLDVAREMNCKAADVDHYENGRKALTAVVIEMLLNIYKVERDFFQKILELKIINRQLLNHIMLSQQDEKKA